MPLVNPVIAFPHKNTRGEVQQRITPQVLESEQSALGAMLMDVEAIEIAVGMVAPEDFYREMHRKIYTVIIDLYMQQSAVDLITVAEELRHRRQIDEVGGPAYLTALVESCPSSKDIKSYIRPLIRASIGRQALSAAEVLTTQIASSGEDGLLAIRDTMARLEIIQQRAVLGESAKIMTGAELAAMNFPPPKWSVPEMIPQGLVILGGKPKAGKSWFAQMLAIAVSCGGYFLGSIKVEQGEVLHLALEDTPRRLQDRQAALLQGAPASDDLYIETEWPRADEGGIERIERWLDTHTRARLVIIDVLQKFRPHQKAGVNVYAEDYIALSAMKKLADDRDIALMVLHHQSKSDKEDQFEKLSGSNAISGAADAMMIIERKRSSGTNEATLHLTGRDVGEEQFALEWDGNIKSWALLGQADEVEEQSATDSVMHYLKGEDDFMAPKDIATDLEIKDATVRTVLRRLLQERRVIKKDRKYRVAHTSTGMSGAAMSAIDD